MKTNFLFIISLFILNCTQISNKIKDDKAIDEDFYEKCRKLVLSENQIGIDYNFKIARKEIDEINLKFLGISKTTNGDTLKIINSTNYTGLFEESRKANSNIYVYNERNEPLGFYHVGNYFSLPKELKNNELIFQYDDEDCNQATKVSLKDGLPNEIFILCKEQSGDLYKLEH